MAAIRYRADIDGLRAVAVVAVVLYHLSVPGFSGGFVGVDVFFVISGFLITQFLLGGNGAFSVVAFYERRVRRIIPALAAVLLATTAAAAAILTAPELRGFSHNLAAAVLFVSNFYDLATVSYFHVDSSYEPLLHLWSLAIEEQFYIVYPLALLLLLRYAPHRLVLLLGVAALASFALCAWLSLRNPVAAFYFTPARAWELLLGALTAKATTRPAPGFALEAAAGIGFASILVALTLFQGSLDFPVASVALPCGGTALLIWASEDRPTLVSRALSNRVFVFVGLISYSLYLWHWPLIVFYRRLMLRPLSWTEMVLLLGASFVLAMLSWRFVEQPFRRRQRAMGGRTVFSAALATAALLLFIAAAGTLTDGLPQRFSPERQRVAAYGDYYLSASFKKVFRVASCWDAAVPSRCLSWKPGARNVVLWGDSWAARLYPGLLEVAGRDHVNLLEFATSSCWPVIEDAQLPEMCKSLNREVFAAAAAHADAVILAARLYQRPDDVSALAATARALAAHRIAVIVVAPWPAYDYPVPWLLDRFLASGDARFVADRKVISPDAAGMDASLGRLLSGMPGVHLISASTICPDLKCPLTVANGVPIAWDRGHLTLEGSQYVGRRIWPAISSAIAQGRARALD